MNSGKVNKENNIENMYMLTHVCYGVTYAYLCELKEMVSLCLVIIIVILLTRFDEAQDENREKNLHGSTGNELFT